jgi:DNA transformation protein and related proteins
LPGDYDHIVELFASFRPVSVRRMFGGAGIFADGLMFGLIADGAIYLKADEETIPDFEREALGPFTYETKNGVRSLGYWCMPERLYDDPEELAAWAAAALRTAERGQIRAKPKSKAKPKPKVKSKRSRRA